MWGVKRYALSTFIVAIFSVTVQYNNVYNKKAKRWRWRINEWIKHNIAQTNIESARVREWKNVDMRKIKEGKKEYFVATFYSGGEKEKKRNTLWHCIKCWEEKELK